MQRYLHNTNLFIRSYKELLLFVNKKYGISDRFKTLKDWGCYKGFMSDIYKIRNHTHNNLADDYFSKTCIPKTCYYPAFLRLKKSITKNFILVRHLKKHSVFLDVEYELLYAVHGITTKISNIIPHYMLPAVIHASILSCNEKIIYDGVIQMQNVLLSDSMIKSIKMKYLSLKRKQGIVLYI